MVDQVTELADALTCISECLPPQLMLVAAGFFVQQKFYFSAIKAVHSAPDLLTVRPLPTALPHGACECINLPLHAAAAAG